MTDPARKHEDILKFVVWSLFGSFVFFVPVSLNNATTIPLDHLLTAIQTYAPWFGPLFALAMILAGGLLPFWDRTWKSDKVALVLSILKLMGIGAGFMAFFAFGPAWLLRDDVLPFLWTRVVIPVAIIVPLGSIFLTFITEYGLLEFVGVFMQPVMRTVWKLPGRAAVNAVASFVGSFSIAIFLTNRLYQEGKYTGREAAIILTGFSTVSASFMVIVARTLGLMHIWNTFFWTTMLVTCVVSAITARIRPLNALGDSYCRGVGDPELPIKGNRVPMAIRAALTAAGSSEALHKKIWMNLKDGISMSSRLVSTVISVGLMSFVLVKMTPVFDYIAIVYYPFTYLTFLPDPGIIAKASAVAGAEMFIPSALVAGMEGVAILSKFVVGVVSISIILFFSGSIPCILATDVRLSIPDLVIIMAERTIFTLILVAPIAHAIFRT